MPNQLLKHLHSSPALGLARACLLLLITNQASPAQAQSSDSSDSNNDPHSYEIGVHSGPFLPNNITGITEIVPGWGIRGAVPTDRGDFEFDSFLGRGNGVTYNSFSLDYRLDIVNDMVPAHFLIGIHTDSYSPLNSSGSKTSSGWHFGGGTTQEIVGPLSFRADFKYRMGPGNSVYVGVGLVYRFSDSTTQ